LATSLRRTLFLYTTLFRSVPAPARAARVAPRNRRGHRRASRHPLAPGDVVRPRRAPTRLDARASARRDRVGVRAQGRGDITWGRSEEHTSELKSPDHLVWR